MPSSSDEVVNLAIARAAPKESVIRPVGIVEIELQQVKSAGPSASPWRSRTAPMPAQGLGTTKAKP